MNRTGGGLRLSAGPACWVAQIHCSSSPLKRKGTVFGEQCTCYTACTCPGCPSCDPTCEHTCASTCGQTCWETCDDDTCWSCARTCANFGCTKYPALYLVARPFVDISSEAPGERPADRLLDCEAVDTEKPEPKSGAPAMAGGGGMGDMC